MNTNHKPNYFPTAKLQPEALTVHLQANDNNKTIYMISNAYDNCDEDSHTKKTVVFIQKCMS